MVVFWEDKMVRFDVAPSCVGAMLVNTLLPGTPLEAVIAELNGMKILTLGTMFSCRPPVSPIRTSLGPRYIFGFAD